jgi:N6-L-threonylcarbamoyladenine synthase
MRILGIETSADETGVAIIEASGTGEVDFRYKVLGNALLSQADLHTRYGGIFPNLARREHGRNLVPVLMEALRQSNELIEGTASAPETIIQTIEKMLERETELHTYLAEFFRAYGKPNVDCIAVTAGPGLEPALWVGINFAKALSLAWNLPIVPVNHLEGHIIVARAKNEHLAPIALPAIALLVSGGHTELVYMKEWMHYEILGSTRDDAAGEAFDKIARLMGLPYPGGPQISRLAEQSRAGLTATPNEGQTFTLPRPMLRDPSYDFSFSGLKTAVKKIVEGWGHGTDEMKRALAREAEDAIVEVLLSKTKRAIQEYGAQTVIVGGGVSANEHLRKEFSEAFKNSAHVLFPTPEFATDNAVMIALAGYFHACNNEFVHTQSLQANGNLRLA